MNKRPTPAKKDTVEMCFHKDPQTGKTCELKPKWTVSSEKTAFRVCDNHLPWGIRVSGAPALVEEYKSRDEEDTQPIKYDLENDKSGKGPSKVKSTYVAIAKRKPVPREEDGGRSKDSDHPFEK